MSYEPWQEWGTNPTSEGTLEARATGELPETECSKQLAKLVSQVYQPGARILDVGCNVGHYLRSLRNLGLDIDYTGVDAYSYYIKKAQRIFKEDKQAIFVVKDITEPLFPDNPFDITFCCNVILHLPDFKTPVQNLLESTKDVCFIRTLLGKQTTIVKLIKEYNPLSFRYLNTYLTDYFVNYIKDLGWKVEVIDDEFNPEVIAKEFMQVKKGCGTRIVDGKQVEGNIIYEWKFVKITRTEGK